MQFTLWGRRSALAFASEAKSNDMNEAKARFGK